MSAAACSPAPPEAGRWTLKAVADFSGDGKADLLWSDGAGNLAQWHMDGASYIGGGVFAAAGAGWSLASIADFEGDGHADLLWQHSGGALSLWAMDGTSLIDGGALGARPSGWDLVTLGQFVTLPMPLPEPPSATDRPTPDLGPLAQSDIGVLLRPEDGQNAWLA